MPPYVIFPDTVLRDLAAMQPQTLDDLAQVKGVGAYKLERYGEAVLRVLRRRVTDPVRPGAVPAPRPRTTCAAGRTMPRR